MELSIKRCSYVAASFMIAVGLIYSVAAYFESAEFNVELGAQIETMFFTTAAILYFPLGVWMLKNGFNSRAPYVMAIIGSVALIGLYIASRMISLPVVGKQDDVGILDISSKILQVAIIVVSSILIPKLKKEQVHPIV
ncbi:MAG TPA: hypothetical protein VJR22_07885 [Candidatus Nitrosotalea sp.]|nr:hypothetical protein [Nitrososphaerota archaeon]HKU33749.1 hypothetical protein [Candidatus Nitrosotalea sp.]